MFDERAFIAEIEEASVDELARLVAYPTPDEERALRAYFGDERYLRMHGRALRLSSTRGFPGFLSTKATAKRGNVVVIHGIMGSDLANVDTSGGTSSIWVNILRLIAGAVSRLRLADDGLGDFEPNTDIRSTGIMKRAYGEILLALSENWNVRPFWFDWRKDLNVASAALQADLKGWFADDEPVNIVAHSMGGLVARTFILNNPDQWKRMAGPDGKGGRLIMLGTPNYGSFIIPQVMMGIEDLVRKLELADLVHNMNDLLPVFNSFVGSYQMLPWPEVAKGMEPLFKRDTYVRKLPGCGVSQTHLDKALDNFDALKSIVDNERMIYVAGYNQPTYCNITDFDNIDKPEAYETTLDGDGRVTHDLGIPRDPVTGERVPSVYFVQESHGNLVSNDSVLAALDDLLDTGKTSVLSDAPVAMRGLDQGAELKAKEEAARKQFDEDTKRLQLFVQRVEVAQASRDVATRGVGGGNGQVSVADEVGGKQTDAGRISPEEQALEEVITRGYLSTSEPEDTAPDVTDVFAPVSIKISIKQGEIQSVTDKDVDAIAVGHYLGSTILQSAEEEIDRVISTAIAGKGGKPGEGQPQSGLLAQYASRGILRGDLAQPFFLDDPRSNGSRLIVIAGMGAPGRFGLPELTVLSRELCWSVGRMGKKHLATVLIGNGNGNLPVREAVWGWIRGIKNAVTGMHDPAGTRLTHVTFVIRDPAKVQLANDAIIQMQKQLNLENRLDVDYTPLSQAQSKKLERDALNYEIKRLRGQVKAAMSPRRRGVPGEAESGEGGPEPVPTRVTFTQDGNVYRFGAITETASIPERTITLDPKLVAEANEELVRAQGTDRQLERGEVMERLLIPDDLREQLYSEGPLVMLLDSTLARVHWEVVAQPEATFAGADASDDSDPPDRERYLGMGRYFTRQLRTTLAPPPEPPPPPQRLLRVLIVADPARDNRLPGAEREGFDVADLFAQANRVYDRLGRSDRVEVKLLLGPSDATRTNVLGELMLKYYDVLHFAGHCRYVENDTSASGWIFSDGAVLSANELSRIDRVPRFVFSNACESGITPDRSEERSVGLAPSFAEEVFSRGVSNFVCTAWPVDDVAARLFALTVYAGLLGLKGVDEQPGKYEPGEVLPMYRAMRSARDAIYDYPPGTRTWGAYQHYGDPYMRFFASHAAQE